LNRHGSPLLAGPFVIVPVVWKGRAYRAERRIAQVRRAIVSREGAKGAKKRERGFAQSRREAGQRACGSYEIEEWTRHDRIRVTAAARSAPTSPRLCVSLREQNISSSRLRVFA
jgi:hypothetical protein